MGLGEGGRTGRQGEGGKLRPAADPAAGAAVMRRPLPGQPAGAAGHARGYGKATSEFLQSLTRLPF